MLFLLILAAALVLYRGSGMCDLVPASDPSSAIVTNMRHPQGWPARLPSPRLVPQVAPFAAAEENYRFSPLYYWAAAGLTRLAGVRLCESRVAEAACLAILVVVTYFFGKTLVSVRCGFTAAMAAVTSPALMWWGRLGGPDTMAAAVAATALLLFFRAHAGRGGPWQYWLFWSLAGAAALVDGVAGAIAVAAAVLYLAARAPWDGFGAAVRRSRPVSGLVLFLLVAAPWYVAAHVATGGEFTRAYWSAQVLAGPRLPPGEAAAPWYYYLASLPRDFFPWSALLPLALVQPWRAASREHLVRLVFPCVWLAAGLVVLSAAAERGPATLLLVLPPAAVLVGYLVDYCLCAQDAAMRRWLQVAMLGAAAAAAAGGAAVREMLLGGAAASAPLAWLREVWFGRGAELETWMALARLAESWPAAPAAFAAPLVAGGAAAAVAVWRGRPALAVTVLVCASVAAFVLFAAVIVPVV